MNRDGCGMMAEWWKVTRKPTEERSLGDWSLWTVSEDTNSAENKQQPPGTKNPRGGAREIIITYAVSDQINIGNEKWKGITKKEVEWRCVEEKDILCFTSECSLAQLWVMGQEGEWKDGDGVTLFGSLGCEWVDDRRVKRSREEKANIGGRTLS